MGTLGTFISGVESYTLAGHCRPGSVQSLRSGVHVSAQHGFWIPVHSVCQPVSGIPSRRHLRPADRGHLDFPHVRLATYGRRTFAAAGVTV